MVGDEEEGFPQVADMLATAHITLPSLKSPSSPHSSSTTSLEGLTLPVKLPGEEEEASLHVLGSISRRVEDDELTSLSWLQNPGVLTTMCNALTGSPHRLSPMGTRTTARRGSGSKLDEEDRLKLGPDGQQFKVPRKGTVNSAEKMLNVVLSVRNKRYNGEDAHKPPLSFACMIFMALESSPTKTLPVKQIYEWVQWKFPYYQSASPGWKNSIRHNLSLNKCFKKVEKFSKRSKSIITKGGLWTVDSSYRESLLSALKLNPYHPYHKYFIPPYFPRSMIAALREELELAVSDKGLDAAERDAALSICLISGAENGGVDPAVVRAIYHDHCYTDLPTPPPSPAPSSRSGLNLEEVLAAAELILGNNDEVMETQKENGGRGQSVGGRRSKRKRKQSKKRVKRRKINGRNKAEDDEAYNSSEDNDCIEDCSGTDIDSSLADSGYNGPSPLSHESRSSSLDDLRGANALLCLANIVGETQPLDVKEPTVSINTSTTAVRRSTRTTGKVF